MEEYMTNIDALLKKNLNEVFSERDPTRRLAAIGTVYGEGAVLYEPDEVVVGQAAICASVTALLASLPPDFVFTAVGSAAGHHGIGKLNWSAGPPGGKSFVTGTDVAHIDDGLIQTLHVFIDHPPV